MRSCGEFLNKQLICISIKYVRWFFEAPNRLLLYYFYTYLDQKAENIEKFKIKSPGEKMLTIVIPTYNRGDILTKNIDVIIANAVGANILILDNCSTATTQEYIELNDRVKKLANITYIRNDVNIELRGSIYKALEIVETEYALFLSDEDIPMPNISDLFSDFLKKNGSFSAIRPSIMSSTNDVIYAEYPTTIFEKFNGIGPFGLNGNYISGQIYNAYFMRERNLINKARDASYMIPDYTHLLMNMLCAAVGRTAFMSTPYVQKKDVAYVQSIGDPESHASFYTGPYSYGMRCNQFLGLRDALLLAYGGEINKKNISLFYSAYGNLCYKYAHLLIMVQGKSFLKNNLNLQLVAISFYHFALASICSFPYAGSVRGQIETHLKSTLNKFLKEVGAGSLSIS